MLKNNTKGFTLIELMIAFSIFSIIILLVYGTFFTEMKQFYTRASLTDMTLGSDRAMKLMSDTLKQYDQITVTAQNNVYSNGLLIIDVNNDPAMLGSLFNLDETNHTLLDQDGFVVCKYIESIAFIQGPTVYKGMGITDNMILIDIALTDRGATYSLIGGVNLVR